MFIECLGGSGLPCIYDLFVMLFVYRCKREYYLSEFKVLFIIYGELTVPQTKCINNINNPMHQSSHGDCSYSLCVSEPTMLLTCYGRPHLFSYSSCCWGTVPSKIIIFSKENNWKHINKSKEIKYYKSMLTLIDKPLLKIWLNMKSNSTQMWHTSYIHSCSG